MQKVELYSVANDSVADLPLYVGMARQLLHITITQVFRRVDASEYS